MHSRRDNQRCFLLERVSFVTKPTAFIEETRQPSSGMVPVLQPSPADIHQIVMTGDDEEQETD